MKEATSTQFSKDVLRIDAAAEAGMSRIYGGIHWQYDNVDALAVGTALGNHVVDGFLRPRCASE